MTAQFNDRQRELLAMVCRITGQKLHKLSADQKRAYLALVYNAGDRGDATPAVRAAILATAALYVADRAEYYKHLEKDRFAARIVLDNLFELDIVAENLRRACMVAVGGKP